MARLPLSIDEENAQQPTEMLTAALAYAEKGWSVIPLHTPTKSGCSCGDPKCSSPGKHPRTRAGLKDGSADPCMISTWWTMWPNANIGIVTGPQSRLCVVDVDGEDGLSSLARLTEQVELPETATAFTGRKDATSTRAGLHLYFRQAAGVVIRNSAGRLGPGLDVRGDGGYVVAPPSLHASGLRYEWRDPEVEIADPPAWLTNAIKEKPSIAVGTGNQIAEGRRNSHLTSLGGAMRRHGFSAVAIENALLTENKHRCNPTLSEGEVRRIAASVSRYAPDEPIGLAPIRRPDLIRLSDVTAKSVSWLWEPYIPVQMITLLSGDPGAGKTFLALAIAAALTRGESVLGEQRTAPVNVLYLTLENSPTYVLRPRFDAQGGDAEKLMVMSGTRVISDGVEKPGTFSLADSDQLETALSETQARLVVIDPLQSFLGAGVDLHRSNETRPILDGIIRLAERYDCAVLIVRHLSKASGGRALYRGLGSIDITGAARSELFVATDPNDPTQRVMAHAKTNLDRLGESVAYRINEARRLEWRGTSGLTADDLIAIQTTNEVKSAIDEAVEFLNEVLSSGPQPSKEVQAKATAVGISNATLRRAQDRLGIIKHPEGFGKSWMLELPTVDQDS